MVNGWLSSGALVAGLMLLAAGMAKAAGRGPDAAYTIGNYPVEATAADAVTAKDKALQDGQQAAFRSLLKRLVPVVAYDRLAKMRAVRAADLIDGVAVRSERNSSTQYIASLDFAFRPAAVRDVLRREGIPFVDTQAPAMVVLPVALGDTATEQSRLQTSWTRAWTVLDGEHALTPFKVEPPKAGAASLKPLFDGDGSVIDTLATQLGIGRVVVAFARRDGAYLQVKLVGRDAVGAFVLDRSYKIARGDVDYAGELAAVIAAGVLEGRWKSVKVQESGGLDTLAQPPMAVQVYVQYANLQQWQEMRRRLADTPGVEDLQIGGVTARGADIALRYPGGGQALAATLAALGFDMRPNGGTWVIRSGG